MSKIWSGLSRKSYQMVRVKPLSQALKASKTLHLKTTKMKPILKIMAKRSWIQALNLTMKNWTMTKIWSLNYEMVTTRNACKPCSMTEHSC